MNIVWDYKTNNSIIQYNLTLLKYLYDTWILNLPQILPFYAVKCNPDILVLQEMQKMGMQFDCASMHEMQTCINLKIDPHKIIYANPCKFEKDILYALQNGVTMMTFDTICELDKIYNVCNSVENICISDLQLVLRIYASDSTAQCVLSDKYGAYEHEWDDLLTHAKTLHFNIIGISFHIGSGASNPEIFKEAIQKSRKLYELALLYGFKVHILDIGGGFTSKNLTVMAQSINDALQIYFPPELGCTIIAEPGRYFAETIATFYTKIIGKRTRHDGRIDYIVSDSLYGLFNCKLYDHACIPIPEILYSDTNTYNRKIQHQTRIMGCTCDSNEILFDNIFLPEMVYGDWLCIKNFGAYTICATSSFNGINFKDIHHIYNI